VVALVIKMEKRIKVLRHSQSQFMLPEVTHAEPEKASFSS
jgi:hypothetical protein